MLGNKCLYSVSHFFISWFSRFYACAFFSVVRFLGFGLVSFGLGWFGMFGLLFLFCFVCVSKPLLFDGVSIDPRASYV